MTDPVSTLSLILLTVLALAAAVLAVRELGQGSKADRLGSVRQGLLWAVTVGAGLLFFYREWAIHDQWMALEAHVDGLVLIAALMGATLLFLESRARMRGLAAFAMPMVTLLLAWAICASWFTWQVFAIGSIWQSVHLVGVYLGLLFASVAAMAGAMYLYVQRRLRHKLAAPGPQRLPSLEALERLIVRMSAFGFALLTLGLVTGLVVASSGETRLGPGWWLAPKVVLAGVVWLLYALVMNVRHAASFRGTRAAWLSILGLVLVLVTFAVATTLPDVQRMTHDPADESVSVVEGS